MTTQGSVHRRGGQVWNGPNSAPVSCAQLPGVPAAARLPLPAPGTGDGHSTWGLSRAGVLAAVSRPSSEESHLTAWKWGCADWPRGSTVPVPAAGG